MSNPSPRQIPDDFQSAYRSVATQGFGRFLALAYREMIGDAMPELPQVLRSFADLQADRHMGDGGTYRFRAFSRFRLDGRRMASASRLTPIEGNSIFQELEDNPVNGGVVRTYEPLSPEIAGSTFLERLIEADYAHVYNCDPEMRHKMLVVGVHQVRIVARGQSAGHPAPEGIHRDRERFTFQHFMCRNNASGGEFRAYDGEKQLTFAWLQEDCLDTVMFEGTTWHSATPIKATPGVEGHRDIFLVDFDAI